MALIVIKVRDSDKGTVEVEVESEPTFKMDDLTQAQEASLLMLDSVIDKSEKIHSATADGKDLGFSNA